MCSPPVARRQDLLNISPIVTDAAAAVVDDSFLRCFQGAPPDPWNWNVYLFPTWCLGCLIRFGILFPLRCECECGAVLKLHRRLPSACC